MLRLIISLISGAFGILCFSPYDFWPAGLVSISSLYFITLKRTAIQSFFIGFFWGLGFFGFGIHWIYISISNFSNSSYVINVILISLLVIYLSLYPSIFCLLKTFFISEISFCSLVILRPFLWQIIEYLKSNMFLIGFPWLQFGYSQMNGPLKGLAPIFGVNFITFILTIISGLFVYSIIYKNFFIFINTFFIILIFSTLNKIKWYDFSDKKSANIVLVQGNVEHTVQWNQKYLDYILHLYYNLSKNFFNKNAIIIWPESAIPDFERNQTTFLKNLDKKLKLSNSTLITGILDNHREKSNNYFYNSIILLGNKNFSYKIQNYKKYHLVPFGEFIPFKKFLKPLSKFFNIPMSDFSYGNYIQPQLKSLEYNFTASICYEIVFGKQIRDNFHQNTDFLINLSNDSWFGNSIGPWQHFQIARMRALELGRPLLRSSNNGITAIIDASGKIQNIIPQFKNQVLNAVIVPTKGLTPYARFGEKPLLIFLSIFFIILKKNKKNF